KSMKLIATAVTLGACLALPVQAQLSGSYTIDSSAPTGGTNFATFTEAAAALGTQGVSGPVAFIVATGTGAYQGFGIPTAIAGSSAVNTITFIAGSGQAPVVTGPAAGNVQTIKLGTANTANSGPSYITLSGLTVDGAPSGAAILAAGCTNITVE